jgi:phosphoribosyl 1,2-cyclic phosphodiesterase
MAFFVRFWGVRGSIPTPGPKTRRYGGNTSCVEIRNDDTLVVCDAGTGLRELGVHLMRFPPKGGLTIHLFLSHPHWDHIQGFPFFGPAYLKTSTLNIYCPAGDSQNYRLLSGQMSNAYFPVGFSDLGAKIVPRNFEGDTVKAGSFTVKCFQQKHPGGSLGFRFEHKGHSVVYATDSELDQVIDRPQAVIDHPGAQRKLPADLIKACKSADLLICDAQYLDEEYVSKAGWGHPRATTCVDLAGQAKCKSLVLTHHDPMHSDMQVDLKVAACAERAESLGFSMQVFGAREGIELKVGE